MRQGRLSFANSDVLSMQTSLVQIDLVVSSPLLRARDTAVAISDYQAIDGSPKPELQTMEELTDRDWGSSQGRLVQEVCPKPPEKSKFKEQRRHFLLYISMTVSLSEIQAQDPFLANSQC